MTHTVIGIFENSSDADKAAEVLYSKGFSNENVDISTHEHKDLEKATDTIHSEDSISRFFNSLFGNKEQARYYSEITRECACVVTVHASSDEEAHKAAGLLDEHGAIDIDDRAAQSGYHSSGAQASAPRHVGQEKAPDSEKTQGHGDFSGHESVSGKGNITGDENTYRKAKSKIIEKPVESHLRLRAERINVERKPVDKPGSESDSDTFKEGKTEFIGRKEVPVVEKEPNTKEININKDVSESEETLSDDVKRKGVDADTFDREEKSRDKNLGDERRKY